MILVLDNYDSFTFNLVQYLGELGADPKVLRNDAVSLAAIRRMNPERIVISPGPGRPEDAGISVGLVQTLGPKIPLLGVCLGHQAIAVAWGARIVPADRLLHGKTSRVIHNGRDIFRSVENPVEATRYHSLIVDKDSLPEDLLVTAWTADQEIMGLRHRKYPIHGVQFHPESILTPGGKAILRNFLEL
ncbi:MAG: aminodeoxychorismate/anthranilate synthase component II [Gemmatimonadota bacterium]|jgi:anthranilate synthase component 2|nr:aminodeoxychorismate/anthranilate synthase component II [Gemmatimonadota bacterium]MDP6802087.1 aminodeoxychorismate/anthranilate synthase component II [Gemmatimonadota bacterium]MDP7032656.1 aminodeoxychorismate/anthranilate synthase component II [Gemmatimonadota bacterium]